MRFVYLNKVIIRKNTNFLHFSCLLGNIFYRSHFNNRLKIFYQGFLVAQMLMQAMMVMILSENHSGEVTQIYSQINQCAETTPI